MRVPVKERVGLLQAVGEHQFFVGEQRDSRALGDNSSLVEDEHA